MNIILLKTKERPGPMPRNSINQIDCCFIVKMPFKQNVLLHRNIMIFNIIYSCLTLNSELISEIHFVFTFYLNQFINFFLSIYFLANLIQSFAYHFGCLSVFQTIEQMFHNFWNIIGNVILASFDIITT